MTTRAPPGPSRGRRRRILSAEERALWAHVVQAVAPLRPAPRIAPAPSDASPAAAPPSDASNPDAGPPEGAASRQPGRAPSVKGTAKAPSAQSAPPVKPLAPLEPKARRRLMRGAQVGARLDLHGLTQAAAHARLRRFLVEAHAAGHSVVLVITGKGAERGEDGGTLLFGEARGILRRAVPHWLAEPALRAIVLGFEEAGPRHGGAGALYVRLRRGGISRGDLA